MDIHGPRTLALLRDENVSKAVDELIDNRRVDSLIVVTATGKRVRVRRLNRVTEP